MANFLRDGEQMLQNQAQGGDNTQQSGGTVDQQQGGGMQQGGDIQQGGGQSQQTGSGSGLLSGLEAQGKDTMINQEVDQFATSEGVPASMDGMINSVVDKEI